MAPKSLLEPEARITKDRGRWFETKCGGPAIATYHPAYLLCLTGQDIVKAKWEARPQGGGGEVPRAGAGMGAGGGEKAGSAGDVRGPTAGASLDFAGQCYLDQTAGPQD